MVTLRVGSAEGWVKASFAGGWAPEPSYWMIKVVIESRFVIFGKLRIAPNDFPTDAISLFAFEADCLILLLKNACDIPNCFLTCPNPPNSNAFIISVASLMLLFWSLVPASNIPFFVYKVF